MPSYFGELLAAPYVESTTTNRPLLTSTENPENPNNDGELTASRVHHHFHHHLYNSQKTPVDMKKWYMQHMSDVLSSSVTPLKPNPRPLRSSTPSTTTVVPPNLQQQQIDMRDFLDQMYGGQTQQQSSEETTLTMSSCPATCTCTCPQGVALPQKTKKVDLAVTLMPCARSATYQLDLAIRLCKKRRK
jgi:hypothetical protein